ncbi:SDR family NAD(P)-dependent oxidoreductase [Streptomyces sp. RKND-216]|uniref:SDR family NAD(P)-dependent oxidoreductase n=1 Tax=Streptomyces sp. RKND-216 TaxID=2562581 RepID=UPI00109DC32D|nr:SDR family NAD(P)-dependent oxidoreductase [Streptomyces sp. RKND-216]THA24095.1 SDR family NAD(P)-dependent oxidoreductase [Streptomyces sp. RKND-216]
MSPRTGQEPEVEYRLVVEHSDFVMQNHRVHGVSVMPGVTFLDLVLRVLQAEGFDVARAELRNVLFQEPLATTEGHEREIRVVVTRPDEGARRVTVESRWRRDGSALSPYRQHVEAELLFRDRPEPPPLDVPALRGSAHRTTDMDDMYARARVERIVHGDAMRCFGRIHHGPAWLLAELTLDAGSAGFDSAFRLHPAKLDCSTIVAFTQVDPVGDDPFIPVFIESFRAPRPLGGTVHAHVPQPETQAPSGDVMHNSYTLHDDEGRLLAEFTKLTCKRIRHPELIGKLLVDTARAPGADAASAPTGTRTDGTSEDTGMPGPAESGTVAHLRDMVATRLGRRPVDVPVQAGFYDMGLDSAHMLEMSRELEGYVRAPLYPTLLFEFSDVASLAAHLDARYPAADRPAPTSAAPPATTPWPENAPTEPEPELLCYRPCWAVASLPVDPPGGADGGPFVLIGADDGLVDAMVVLAGEDRIVRVERAQRYEQVSERHFRLDTTDPAQLGELCAAVTDGSGDAPVAYVRVAAPGGPPDEDDAPVPLAHREGHALATAVTRTRPTAVVALLFLHATEGEGRARPAEGALAGFARTVAAEAPLLRCRTVGYETGLRAEALARILLAESADRSEESEVRHRGTVREAVRFSPLRPPVAPADGTPAPRLREHGVYLVTGGAGGIAGLLADRLVREVRARIVLTGRRAPDAALEERMRDWRARGAEVSYIRGDVSLPEDVDAVVARTRTLFGRIDGVFHCAGAVRDGMFFRTDASAVAEVLAAKVRGTRLLDAATASDRLDFFLLFSSISATLPNLGQSHYAYANAFLDHFAEHRTARRDRHGVTVSLGWSLWADGGMQVTDDVLRRSASATGFHPMPSERGLDVLLGALAADTPRLVLPHGESGRLAAAFPEPSAAVSAMRNPTQPEHAPGAPLSSSGAPAAGSAPHDPLLPSAPTPGLPSEGEPVAVIGLDGRYPGADGPAALWALLEEGRDGITEVPADRWDHSAVYHEEKGRRGHTYGRWGGFLDGADRFDAEFFGISRREAERMDPQERLFLTVSWRAVEDAGYRPDTLGGGNVGVFAGVMWNHYQLLTDPADGVAPTALHCSVANRVSYCLDFRGPSMAVDTACSSSLTALHLAVESLRRGECDAAVAGGVNLAVHPQKYLQLAEGHFLSEDGRCRSFGEGGTGYVPGEGVGAVVLKPLSRALADGDTVHAVIRGSFLNHAGRTSGYTVPSPSAQASLIRRAVDRSSLDPATIGYIEAHGTGTSLGDPIEIEGLRSAFADVDLLPGSCAIGSVKSAIGHLESAAGIAAVTKVLLQMKHRRLAPSLHAERLNPHIDFASSPFRVQREAADWLPAPGCTTLRAGVSAFGAGGANAHVLLEEWPRTGVPEEEAGEETAPRLFVFSARDRDALTRLLRRHVRHVQRPTVGTGTTATAPAGSSAVRVTAEVAAVLGVPEEAVDPREPLADLGVDRLGLAELARRLGGRVPAASVRGGASIAELAHPAEGDGTYPRRLSAADVAHTLQVGRVALPVRVAVVARGLDELLGRLEEYLDGETATSGVYAGSAPGEGSADADTPAARHLVELYRAGELHEVARQWVVGTDIRWEDCYVHTAGRRPLRVPLPVQPFTEKRYWVGEWNEAGQRPATTAEPTVPVEVADSSPTPAALSGPADPAPVRAETSAVPPAWPEPGVQAVRDTDREEVRQAVEDALCAELYLERHEIDARSSFHELGLDSVGAVRVTQRLAERFDVDVESTAVFDHPTVPRMTDHVLALGPVNRGPSASTAVPGSSPRSTDADDIAVIGMSGRFPGAENLHEFWENLAAGRHSFAEIPPHRWAVESVYDPDRRAAGRTYSKWAAMLPDVDRFDAALFNISPLEAEVMDPQQRLFLQQAWSALDDAGYAVQSGDPSRCGVFVGCAPGDYGELLGQAGRADGGHAFLGSTSSLMPARISYLLNLVGPTLAVDTACSSSLVAVHLAAESIRRGECATALAGGVALMVTPQLHIRTSKVGMLSPTGSCRPFDAQADGTVLGEGVGCVVLKRLDRALADGDHIHGVIKATGINGDGRTNGITAPSAVSQAALLAEVHARAGVTADHIGYVEAHGTGTPLGDPIEARALTDVFRRTTDRAGYCGIGTVKANIGHTTMAAGIAGLLKVLLALRHGELPPAPAFDTPNPRTGLEGSPFFVVRERRPWVPGPDGTRVATVSSFGFSGTNAHAVVAEAPPAPAPPREAGGAHLFPVSGQDKQALSRALVRLADALEDEPPPLVDVAYTLAVGRSHWAVRAAFVAEDRAELRQQLRDAARSGNPRTPGAEVSTPGGGRHGNDRRAELERLAQEYVAGKDLDWSGLFTGREGRRVPLPPYPFADQRHWVGGPEEPAGGEASKSPGRHPHLGAPVSSSDEAEGAVFDVAVPDGHWLLDHHRVGGRPVLPGAAGLDLAASAARASGLTGPLRLTGVRWLRLVDPSAAGTLRVRLTPAEDGYTFILESRDRQQRYVQGDLVTAHSAEQEPDLDLSEARRRCPRSIPAARFYEDFRSGGIEYGENFRTLSEVRFGEREALGRFAALPRPGFTLDPCLLDGAQQLVAAVEGANETVLVPFALDSVTLTVPGAVPQYAHVERVGPHRYGIRLADASGRVCARYDGLLLRAQQNPVDEMVYRPVWRETAPVVPPAEAPDDRRTVVVHTQDAHRLAEALAARTARHGQVTTVPLPDAGAADLRPLDDPLDVVYFVAGGDEPAVPPEEDTTALTFFRLVKRFLAAGRQRERLELRIVTSGAVPADAEETVVPHAAGLLGLARAVESECPRWRVSCVDVSAADPDLERTADLIVSEPGSEPLVLLRGGRRLERTFAPVRLPAPEGTAPFRSQGTYVIAGGAGGIGFALSRLLARIAGARLVWLGRSPRGPEHESKAREIEALGGRALYLQADVADEAALRRALERVRTEFGAVHGAVHAALDLRDRTIAHMDEAEFAAGLAPKVAGVTAFSRALEEEPLDFLLIFSSAVSFVEAGGQANYAAASTFEDAYAQWLDRRRPYPVSVVNWGFWGSVGAVANDRMRKAFTKLGIGSIEPAEGMAVLRRVISARLPQVLAMKAEKSALPGMGIRIRGAADADAAAVRSAADPTALAPETSAAASVAPSASAPRTATDASGGADLAPGAVRAYVAGVFAEVLKHPAEAVDEEATFENFGVDSLVSLSIVDRFEQDLGDLPSTLLFEHMTISRLAAHLREEHGERLATVLSAGVDEGDRAAASAPAFVGGSGEPAPAPDGDGEDLAEARRGFAAVESYSRTLLRDAFHRMEGRPVAGETSPVAVWERRMGVVERHRRLFHASLEILCGVGSVRREGPGYVLTGAAESPDEALADEIIARHPTMEGHVRLVERCVDALGDVLTGRRDPMDVLFPKGSVSLVEPIYRGQPITDHFNHTLAQEVAEAARQAHGRRGSAARVLEIGAGTGSSSGTVLAACEELGDGAVQYVYTDISPAFLRHGEREFGATRPYLSFEQLDISKDPTAQGFPAGEYDVVLATHVLHATPDIRRTLAHIGTLLRPGGVALVNEITRVSDFLTLTFGLTTGWWMYEDAERRLPHTPLLSTEQWRTAAEAVDLTVARTHGVPGATPQESAQSLVVVEKPRNADGADEPGDLGRGTSAARAYVAGVFAEVLKHPVEALDEEATFENFGVDSLVSLSIVDRFEQDLGDLPSTLLFEHVTLDRLAAYLEEHHGDRIPVAAVPQPGTEEPPAPPEPGDRDPARPAEGAPPPAPAPTAEVAPAGGQSAAPRVTGTPGTVTTAPAGTPAATSADDRPEADDIAIIGVAGRYPGSPDLETFWTHLSRGNACIGEIPEDRWDWRPHFDTRKGVKHRTYNRWGGFLEGVDAFDAPLFGILPREANDIDPQERLFLETCWELLESTGHLGERTREPLTGVFAGLMYGEYGLLAAAADWPEGRYATGHSAYWSLANRVSYTFDLQGPSLALDSACSSALTAVHLACESLRRGECAMAIAGGVNLILHPAHFAALAARNMLSTGDACRVFDSEADGFVPGEGAGAVLLKPLARARADGDTVWAVVKGSLSNAGGKVSGYTVPNPNAQARLIEETLRRSGVHPRTVSYVEAHGTGTALGDPIEVAGLTRAFRAFGVTERGFCGVGSVKSNIGHLEGAAGIAALTKVLLQFRHRTLAPTINLRTVNPKIGFAESPFRPQHEAARWERPEADIGTGKRTWPRRAGISSFGAGGANVHLVLEEYTEPERPEGFGDGGAPVADADVAEQQVFVLSALSGEALRRHASRTAAYLRTPAGAETPLRDLAASSQTGRRELPERLAVCGSDHEAIAAGLQRFAAGEPLGGGVHNGTASGRNGDGAFTGAPADDLSADAQDQRARHWVNGGSVDWHGLWVSLTEAGRPAPRRAVFPTYPFERRRYWIAEHGRGAAATPATTGHGEMPDEPADLVPPRPDTAATDRAAAHREDPPAPASTRTLTEGQETTVGRDRPIVTEELATHPALGLARYHLIDDAPCVPGVALLTVVAEALLQTRAAPAYPLRMTDIRWVSPVNLDAGVERVRTTLTARESGGSDFEVRAEGASGPRTAARGLLAAPDEKALPSGQTLALEELRRRYRRRIPSADLYDGFVTSGLRHGRPLRVVADLWVGDGEALARLANSHQMRQRTHNFRLDPALLDGALQAVSVLCRDEESYLPVGVTELQAEAPLPMDCWAQVREVTPDGSPNGHRWFDIRLTDGDGWILQRLDGLEIAPRVARKSESASPNGPVPSGTSAGGSSPEGAHLRYLRPVWEPAARPVRREPARTAVVYAEPGDARGLVVDRLTREGVGVVTVSEGGRFARTGDGGYTMRLSDPGDHDLLVEDLATRDALPDALVHLPEGVGRESRTPTRPSDPPSAALPAVLWSSAAVLRRPERPAVRVLYAHPGPPAEVDPYDSAVGATLRTLALEHTRLHGVRLALPPAHDAATARTNADLLVEELLGAQPGTVEIRHLDGLRQAKDLRPFTPVRADRPPFRLRAGGTYLITGGAGAVGRHFARYFTTLESDATVVLASRTAPTADLVAELNSFGARVVHRRVDLRDADATMRLVAAVREEFAPLRGVLHAAGVTRDARAVRKTPREVADVLGPKVEGTVHLDRATAAEPLDFFVLFSSMSGEAGNPGQADYAYANAFQDEFAARRVRQVAQGIRAGVSLAICWPLWAEGGMRVDDATRELFARKWDMVPLSTRAGLDAFVRALESGEACCAVVEGQAPAAARDGAAPIAPLSHTALDGSPAEAGTRVRDLAEREARLLAAEFLLVDESDVDVRAELLELGFDSITLTELVNKVNERFGLDLLPTVLFECPDLAAFADYLAEHHRTELLAALGDQDHPLEPRPEREPQPVEATESRPAALAGGDTSSSTPAGTDQPVAVIGMAGTFPKSPDLETFWAHLDSGDDLVDHIPHDRAALLADPATRTMRGGFLDDVAAFDARLFGISPNEAALMDPQQRLFLQSAWCALEDAGHRPGGLAGSATGLFVGVATHDYDDLLKEHGVASAAHAATGIAHSVLPNRVSYLLDLHGPSEAVDTACSSSLVALHRAVRSLRDGECEMAVAGGVNVILSPGLLRSFADSGMLSPDGRCATFDAAADGYVRGEGAGAVVLKPLARALADGDEIHAVIRGSAVNHGGRSPSLTAPNPEAQARVIARAVRTAGVAPDTLSYIETHGTGTRLGDPVEVEGLKKAFTQLHQERREPLPDGDRVALGAVKSAIGHGETAAGIAGVLKVLLCMRHRILPANLHFTDPNPYLRLDDGPFFVNDRRRSWQPVKTADGCEVYRAGVSSFGFGGSNAHVVLEAYDDGDRPHHPCPLPVLVPLSAGTREDLADYAGRLARHLQDHPEADLARVAYTLQTGRTERPHRFAVAVRDRAALVSALEKFASGVLPAGAAAGTAVRHTPGARGDEGPTRLAALWCEGAAVPWDLGWTPAPGRLRLPTSPFVRTRHWVSGPGGDAPDGVAAPASRSQESPQVKESVVPSVPAERPAGDGTPGPLRRGPKVTLVTPAARTAQEAAASAPSSTAARQPERGTDNHIAMPERPVVGSPRPAPAGPGREAALPAVATLLRDQLADILGTGGEEIGDDVPFAELGLDSIYRMDLVRLLNTTFSLELKAAELYDYDTVGKLSGFVAPLCAGEDGGAPVGPVSRPSPTSPADPEPPDPRKARTPEGGHPAPETIPAAPVGMSALEQLLLATLGDIVERRVDPTRTFADNGFSSFDMLRSVAALEKNFGALRKTLLFDHPTVPELASTLATLHGAGEAVRLLRNDGPGAPADVPSSPRPVPGEYRGGAVVIEKARLAENPEIARTVADLERRYGREGGLPGRDIAPLLFLGSDRSAYFHCSRRDEVMLTWSYVGPAEQMPALAAEYVRYGRAHGRQANIVSLLRLEEEAGVHFTATPFGALQRLEDIQNFSLAGGRMARLRYLIGRFEKSGECRTVEYEVGSDRTTDRAITEMIDRWGDAKAMVNPYVSTVRDEIGRGILQQRHRMFLTYVDDRMVSAVIVTKIPSEPGYLLDLEFYPEDAPPGGLDYAVVKIIERTAAEGCTVFSFGGSFGARIGESPNAAPEVEAALAELRSRGIFTGDGNFRFKNKFRPDNHPLYLCQPAGEPRTDVSRLILMIADPEVGADRAGQGAATPEAAPAQNPAIPPERPAPAPTGPADLALDRRTRHLEAHGWNPLLLPADLVDHDLVTDSWAELGPALTAARTGELQRRAVQLTPGHTLEDIDLLPFSCVVPTPSGRAAEAALCRAWPSRGPVVVHNSVFPTWYFSLMDNGFQPVGVRTDPAGALRGDIDLDHLEAVLTEHAGRIAFLCVETGVNAQGGAPLSLANLTAVRELADRHAVRLVLDTTRVLDNAVLITTQEKGRHHQDPFEVAQEILSLADAVTMSLSKNFGTDSGGIVATDDPEVAAHLTEHLSMRGPAVSRTGRAETLTALRDHRWAVRAVHDRVHRVARIHQALSDAGLPLLPGPATHCVLLETGRMRELRAFRQPVPAVLAWIYRHTGIRAAAHLGSGKEDAGLVRLAVPVGMEDDEADEVVDRLTRLFADRSGLRDLLPATSGPGTPALARFHPAEHVPEDIREALAEGYTAQDETAAVLRELAEHVERHLLEVPGGQVEVWSAGNGPALLLMLPFNIGAGLFGPQFTALADRYRVIVVHHPGVGATTAADDLSYAGLADLARQALGALGVREPVHIAGASFGGLVAQTFALRHPESTASLTLVGSSYKLGNRADEANRLGVVVEEDFDHVERNAASPRFARDRAHHEQVLLRSESMDPLTGLRYLDVFAAEPDLLDRLADVSAPTLIVHGRHDTVIPLKTAHLLHGLIPHSRYHEVADAGHFPSLTSAEEFNDVLTAFLAQHPAGVAAPSATTRSDR